jgi:hypothetical protein
LLSRFFMFSPGLGGKESRSSATPAFPLYLTVSAASNSASRSRS